MDVTHASEPGGGGAGDQSGIDHDDSQHTDDGAEPGEGGAEGAQGDTNNNDPSTQDIAELLRR